MSDASADATDVPAAFRVAQWPHVALPLLIGVSVGMAVAIVLWEIYRFDRSGGSVARAFVFSTATVTVWAQMVVSGEPVASTTRALRTSAGVKLAMLNSALTCAIFGAGPDGPLVGFVLGLTFGAIVWVPAFYVVYFVFGYGVLRPIPHLSSRCHARELSKCEEAMARGAGITLSLFVAAVLGLIAMDWVSIEHVSAWYITAPFWIGVPLLVGLRFRRHERACFEALVTSGAAQPLCIVQQDGLDWIARVDAVGTGPYRAGTATTLLIALRPSLEHATSHS